MKPSPPPSKGTALHLAHHYHQLKNHPLSWNWLFVWAFYDHWIEGYWND